MAINILLVEDNPIIRNSTIRLFQELKLEIDVAINYQEAVNHIRSKHYDLVLTDIGLPDKDGIAVTQQLRKIESQEDRPKAYVCGATAFVLDEYRTACFNAGMNDLVSKPINLAFIEKLVFVALKYKELSPLEVI